MLKQTSSKLLESVDLSIRLTWYGPGQVMTDHAHDLGQVSILLTGGMREIVEDRCAESASAHVGFKPSGLRHANVYSESGALILSLNFPDQDWPSARSWNWQPASRPEIALVRQIVAPCAGETERRESGHDLAASVALHPSPSSHPPAWSRQLRDRFHAGERVDLHKASEEYGIHPAHLSRGFRKWFGAPPSLYALRWRMSRAVKALVAGESAAEAAQTAGFTDQSHLIRTLKRETGMTPLALTRQLAA